MKKIATILLAMTILIACNNDIKEELIPTGESSFMIELVSNPLSVTTRSYFNDDSQTEPWETKISHLNVSVFDENENYIDYFPFTEEEIESGKKMIGVAEEYLDKELIFVVVVNNNSSSQNYRNLLSIMTGISKYSANYTDIITGNMKNLSYGFDMGGISKARKNSDGSITMVPIELERVVNKVGIHTKLGDTFRSNYKNGDLKVTNISIHNYNSSSTIQRQETPDVRIVSSGSGISQDSFEEDGYFKNLFYLFETNENMVIRIIGLFDEDGDFTTTDDQQTVYYYFETDICNAKRYIDTRNNYYRLSITIHGLPDNISPNFIVEEDWNSPIDIDRGIGY